MRIAVHDFVGHPFVFELSLGLARAGHEVRHLYFGGYPGPKGAVRGDPPPGLSVREIAIDRPYVTERLAARLRGNLAYARRIAAEIADFRPDVTLSGNTPTEIQGAVLAATHRAGGRFIHWMQDFYSVAVSSLLRGRWLGLGDAIGAVYRGMDRRQLRDSDGIVVISDAFRPEIARFGVGDRPIWTVPNWGALDEIDVRPKHNPWSRAHGLGDRFVFLYSGTLGLKHDPALLLRLAAALRDDPQALVVVAAQGSGRTALERMLAGSPQPNLRVMNLQPIVDFPDMLGTADIAVALLEQDAARFSVPSKVLSYLCAGRASLLSAPLDNLSAQIVIDAEAGRVVRAGDAEAFVAAALALRCAPEERARAGAAGRAYAERHFRIEAVVARFEEIFAAVDRTQPARRASPAVAPATALPADRQRP